MASDLSVLATALADHGAAPRAKVSTGKRRYFVAKTIGASALAKLPTGLEISANALPHGLARQQPCCPSSAASLSNAGMAHATRGQVR
jgi:hypothetical protein